MLEDPSEETDPSSSEKNYITTVVYLYTRCTTLASSEEDNVVKAKVEYIRGKDPSVSLDTCEKISSATIHIIVCTMYSL